MQDTETLARFYDEGYSGSAADADRGSRWRALGARGKADHILALCARAQLEPESTLEIGCGDGALLSELHARGFGGALHGVELSANAAALASGRGEIAAVAVYDGASLPHPDGAFDLGVLSHVLEHVPEPAALLREGARACRAMIVEVPLEANWSARRGSRRALAHAVGHLHSFDRASAREIVAAAGLRIVAELEDPLPRAVHNFAARTPAKRAAGDAKWLLRAGTHRLAPAAARRLFTLHYACLCLPGR